MRIAVCPSARGLLLTAAVLLLVPFANAAEPKPDATLKTKAIEASVFLNEKIKVDPALAADCLAEGQFVAFVPWETLKPYLTPEGLRIFGGARPNGDGDDQQ